MPAVGFDTWFQKQCPTVFKVKNTAKGNKRIRIFSYPIKNGGIRDLLAIPYVSEADIRHSLLKGELLIKILAKEIEVVDSNIDLLQFDPCHKQFLQNAGIIKGLEVVSSGGGGGGDGYILAETPYLWRQEVELIGPKNNSNRNFMIPNAEKFLEGDFNDHEFHIVVEHNGRRLLQNIDFIISESGGIGTGYDTVKLLSLTPTSNSKLIADYVIENPGA